MSSVSPSTFSFCPHCGAANSAQATSCFACQQPLTIDLPQSTVLTSVQQLLKGRYHLLRQLGQGGMGAVYQAEDVDLGNRLVAVKEMAQRGLNQQEIVEAAESFKREALLLAALTHSHLPRIYDHFVEENRWYLVMDFIEGETFESYLDRSPVGGLPLDEALDYALQLCSVLDYLHTRQPPIIFRDLKPANIIRVPDGQLYLIDFGIARLFKPGQVRDTIAFGSPGYAAPEQYGKMQTTPRADLYSLGALLHQMLSGLDPSDTPFFFSPLPASMPAALHVLLQQLLEMDIQKRPASALVVKQALQAITKQQLLAPNSPQSSMVLTHLQTLPRVQAASASPYTVAKALPQSQTTTHPPLLPPMIVSRGMLASRYDQHTNWISALAWAPSGKYLASASYDGTVQLWNPQTAALSRLYKDHVLHWFRAARVYAAVWSPDGQRIASAGEDRMIRIWNTDTGSQQAAYKVHPVQIRAIAWSPDGSLFASTHAEMIHIWQPSDGRDVHNFSGVVGTIFAAAWSPDSTSLAVAGDAAIMRVYELMAQDTRKSRVYQGHTKAIQALCWSPDGRYIATASDDSTVRVWESQSGHAILEYYGHNGPVKAVAWSPDGRCLASAGDDGTVQLWIALSGQVEYVYHGHFASVFHVAWSPDSAFVASSDAHKLIQVWHAT